MKGHQFLTDAQSSEDEPSVELPLFTPKRLKLPLSEEVPSQKFVINPYENKVAHYSSRRIVKSEASKTEIELLDARRQIEKLEARVKEL